MSSGTRVPRIWPHDEIITAAQTWATWAGRTPSWTDWNRSRIPGEPMHPSTRTAIIAFGTWLGMVRAAGLTPAQVGAPRQWTREAIVDALLEDAVRRGRFPYKPEWATALPDRPHGSQVVRRFGSWSAAIREARGARGDGRNLVDAAPVAAALREYIGPDGAPALVAERMGVNVSPLHRLLSGSRARIEHRAADELLTAIGRTDVMAILEAA